MPALNLASQASRIKLRLAHPEVILIACLCAEWCDVCREYHAVFDQLANAYPRACFVWIDIETHADLLGDIEVENFPTIAIEDTMHTHFFGPVLPQPQIVARMLANPGRLLSTASAPKIRHLLAA